VSGHALQWFGQNINRELFRGSSLNEMLAIEETAWREHLNSTERIRRHEEVMDLQHTRLRETPGHSRKEDRKRERGLVMKENASETGDTAMW
jgi:hypothetical protein